MRTKVNIIILNHNGIDDTRECLNSVLKTKFPGFRVVVVDNGSLINEAKILSQEFKNNKVSFLRFNKNWGFTGGNNKALKKINTKYLVLLNNDTVVAPLWLKYLINTMEQDEKIAVAQAKMHSYFKKNFFEYAGAAGGFIDKYGYPFTQGRIFNTVELDEGQYDNMRNIFWASGAAMAIRRSVIKKIGCLFD